MPGTCQILEDPQALEAIVHGFATMLPVPIACEPRMAGVLHSTLSNPGSLTRAQLAWSVLNALGGQSEMAISVATAIEYFHTASLLLDDLPCMDDADTRRGTACPHTVYGESATILGSLAFINRAYFMLGGLSFHLEPSRGARVWELVEACLGVTGVLNGQSLDLHADYVMTPKMVRKVAEGKTVTLLRLSLILPALLGNADEETLATLETLSLEWGLAYQLIDDFKDVLDTNGGKTAGRDQALNRPNMHNCLGPAAAARQLDDHMNKAAQALGDLDCEVWGFLNRLQARLQGERDRLELLAAA